jgi:hypothetical protein
MTGGRDATLELRRAIARLRAGDWRGAHETVQELQGVDAARLHGLLHRIEGDLDNARYWYRQAGVALDTSVAADEELMRIEAGLDRRAEPSR